MTRPNALILVALLAACTLPISAQTSGVPGSTSPTSPAPSSRRGGRQQPCWQVAGISQQTAQEHHQIEEKTRSEVQSVCTNSSLSPQQKQEQIRQLHEQAHKQMEALITPQQQEALKSCREQRGGEHEHGGGMHRGGGEGPCGEMPARKGPNGTKPQPQSEPPSEQQ
jgi:periplasmic protein CpxP/Spy